MTNLRSLVDHGYRYIQVEGLPVKPDPSVLIGHFVHTNVTKDGHVEFKNPSMHILNGIQKAIVYTQLSNFYHHPTDCPQRCEIVTACGLMSRALVFSHTQSLPAQQDALRCKRVLT